MIILMETISPMIREISIEDNGHPYFIYTQEDTDSLQEMANQGTSIIIPFENLAAMKKNTANVQVREFENFEKLVEFVASTQEISVIYKKPLLEQLVKNI